MEMTYISNSQAADTSRDYSVSLIRIVALLLIILCHFMQFYDNVLTWWFNAGVQIFLFMSGYLYGMKELKSGFLGRNFSKILLDYWVYLILCLPFYRLFRPDLVPADVIRDLFLCRTTLTGIAHLWFIPCILFCYLITPLLNLSRKSRSDLSNLQYAVLTVLIPVVAVVLDTTYTNQPATFVTCYILGYLWGHAASDAEKRAPYRKWFNITVPVIALLMNAFQIITSYFYFTDLTELPWYSSFTGYAHISLGIALFLILHRLFQKCRPERFASFLRKADSLSFDIYIVHQIYIQGPLNIEDLTPYRFLNTVLIVLLIGLSAVLLHGICSFLRRTFSVPSVLLPKAGTAC
jgi:surface polysaccharide O-acyltransferase-like enzyme